MRRIERILEEACGTEFTAVVARIEHRGLVMFERAYGTTRADSLGGQFTPTPASISRRSQNSSLPPCSCSSSTPVSSH